MNVVVAGGGPAGMMLGLLLARAGVEVTVLEKHEDFLRDFRGDTVHPSTLEALDELGLAERFHQLRHRKVTTLNVPLGGGLAPIEAFAGMKVKFPYIAFVPQWDFLNLLAEEAQRYPNFTLHMSTPVRDVIRRVGKVVGVRCDDGREFRADLVVGADGRNSAVRQAAGMPVHELGAPIDVIWFRLTRHAGDQENLVFQLARGRGMVAIDRGEFWQCGYLIGKGGFDDWKAKGIEAFRRDVAQVAPMFADRTGELTSFEVMGFLEVRVNRLKTWHQPGLLCIGDAAHAMSPVGGVGINLAVQDAIAAANILTRPLLDGTLDDGDLAAVEHRREWPAVLTQRVQAILQRQAFDDKRKDGQLPALARFLIQRTAIPRYLAGRFLAFGFRPEHIQEIPR
ncbi:FAD-dependent oxidoreductase [Nonomuraea basaltis]|uniref:FAD-dependent oxidoreductase n=1 Tax=Nonomuraea basaltis TaxID=2495887 RepID=UPI00110C619A|nr:FAD-dependent oxidoreductase [Nonomuraea basaltis]TMR91900.1 FAD-dependent oxidoreductase [Nonomuraea basaltis]